MSCYIVVQTYHKNFIIAALVNSGEITDFTVDFADQGDEIGNIYAGIVTNVVHSLSACFVNYGSTRNGFLPNILSLKDVSEGDRIIVQVVRPSHNNKGAKLSQLIKIKEKNTFYSPYIGNSTSVNPVPNDIWSSILKKFEHKHENLLYKNPSNIEEFLHKNFYTTKTIYLDGHNLDSIEMLINKLQIGANIIHNDSVVSIFDKLNIRQNIEDIFSDKMKLDSGGTLVINQTEAMITIDVNSSGCINGDLESTSLLVNLEAAQKIAKQVKLRNLSGIIAIDFIDMQSPKNKDIINQIFVQQMSDDKVVCKISPMNEFSVLMLSRKRSGGNMKSTDDNLMIHSYISHLLSDLRLSINSHCEDVIDIRCSENIYHVLFDQYRYYLVKLENDNNLHLSIKIDQNVDNYSIHPIGKYEPDKVQTDNSYVVPPILWQFESPTNPIIQVFPIQKYSFYMPKLHE